MGHGEHDALEAESRRGHVQVAERGEPAPRRWSGGDLGPKR